MGGGGGSLDPRVLLWYHIEVDQADEVRHASTPCNRFSQQHPHSDTCSNAQQRKKRFATHRRKPTHHGDENAFWRLLTSLHTLCLLLMTQADPVKQRGPLAMTELHTLWKKGAIDRDTFVWYAARTPV